jgi:phosphoglycolate phosphatase
LRETVTNPSLVIFDADGVLIDSLAAHLQMCQNKNVEFGLGLAIPSATRFREMVRQGVKISPMNYFFRAVGFPRKYADLAFEQYKATFMRDYAPKPFPQVGEMLSKLTMAGLRLGIVTSNVRSNVDSALGANMKFFHPRSVITKDDAVSDSKSDALLAVARSLRINVIEAMYVGDQPADWMAAKEAGVNFLGVAYGWGISEEDKQFPVVSSVMGIVEYVLNDVL